METVKNSMHTLAGTSSPEMTQNGFERPNSGDVILSNLSKILKEYLSLECTICSQDMGFLNKLDPNMFICSTGCLSIAFHSHKNKNIPGARPTTEALQVNCSANDLSRLQLESPGCKNAESESEFQSKVFTSLNSSGREDHCQASANSRGRAYHGSTRGTYHNGRGRFTGFNCRNQPSSLSLLSGHGKDLDSDDYDNCSYKSCSSNQTGVQDENVRNFGSECSSVLQSSAKCVNNSDQSILLATRTTANYEKVEKSAFAKYFNRKEMESRGLLKELTLPQGSKQQETKVVAGKPSESYPGLTLMPLPAVSMPSTTILKQNGNPAAIVSNSHREQSIANKSIGKIQSRKFIGKLPVRVRSQKHNIWKRVDMNVKAKVQNVESNSKHWTRKDLAISPSFINGAECFISFVWEATKVTLQTVADKQNLEELQVAIAFYCEKAPPLKRIPLKRHILFALYDKQYYRGQVENFNRSDGSVLIRFLDYGDESTVKFRDCREPCDKLMKMHPVYGITFSLSTIQDVPNNTKLPAEILSLIEQATFTLKIQTQTNITTFIGILHYGENQSLNSVLEKFVVNGNITRGDLESGQTGSSAVSSTGVNPVSNVGYILNSNESTRKSKSNLKPNVHNIPMSQNLKDGSIVRINYMWNYGMLNISATADDDKMEEMGYIIEDYVETAHPMKRIPVKGEIVIAPYNGSNYRAKVVGVKGVNIKVLFVDYGAIARVEYSNLFELTPEIEAYPIYGIVLHLWNMPPNPPEVNFLDDENPFDLIGQVEIVEEKEGEWTGNLWLGEDRTWTELYLQALKELKS